METRHRAVLSRFVLFIVCSVFGLVWFGLVGLVVDIIFKLHEFEFRVVSFGLEQQTQRFMAFGTECKLETEYFLLFIIFFLFLRIACILRRGIDRV